MALDGIHSYFIETRDFAKAAAFWTALGYEPLFELGSKSGGFRPKDVGGAYIFLEETVEDRPLVHEPYFNAVDEHIPDGVEVVEAWADTHWGSRLARVRDPDGRTWVIQSFGQRFPDYS